MKTETRRLLFVSGFGVTLGATLQRVGFADFSEVHKLFLLNDFRLFLTFVGAVVTAMLVFRLLRHGQPLPERPFHPGSVPGGVLFGAGWALTGTCPSATIITLGTGQIPALAAILGMLAGMKLYGWLKPKYFRWPTGGCE